MRFGGRRTSENVEGGETGSGLGLGGGGLGGAGLGMLFSFVFSRFGIVGVIVLLLVVFLFSGNPLGLSSEGQQASTQQGAQQGHGADQLCQSDANIHFACQVLASTEDRWTELFRERGATYEVPRLHVYHRGVNSGCGAAQSAMGPFYCPQDHRIYLDPEFFQELAQRHGAPGDFAQAYVVAHEVGHHVQTLTGIADRIRQAQSGAGEREGNAAQVRMELQADCYAGVWAARERVALDAGDIEEGMTAAAAIGDDTLQRAGQGYVVPESFTHGTSAQRQEALMRGFQGGDPNACASYTEGL